MSCRSFLAPAVLAVALILTSCSDDGSPTASPWVAQTLPSGSQGTSLWDLASDGTRVVAVGGQSFSAVSIAPALFEGTTGSADFVRITPSSVPTNAILTGVTFDADSMVVVGGLFDGFGDPVGAVVLDQRGGWSQHIVGIDGAATCVEGDGAGTLWAGALSGGGAAIQSTSPDAWVPGDIFLTSQEAQVNDVASNGTDFFICGWNDAGTPENFVARRGTTGWNLIPGGPVDDTTAGDYRALYVDGGALFVGGTVNSGDGDTAFLVSYSDLGGWTQMVIPIPVASTMEAINDLQELPDGQWLFACGLRVAALWRWNPADGSWTNEGPNLPGRMTALVRTASGAMYAAGWNAESPSLPPDPLLYRRN